jgi:hypothetical protein
MKDSKHQFRAEVAESPLANLAASTKKAIMKKLQNRAEHGKRAFPHLAKMLGQEGKLERRRNSLKTT